MNRLRRDRLVHAAIRYAAQRGPNIAGISRSFRIVRSGSLAFGRLLTEDGRFI
jgi:hypothetical protein